jgi:hypothetical protein
MKYLTDENGNITDVVLNINLFDNLPDEIKDFLLFGEPYEETDKDLILTDDDKQSLEEALKESENDKTRKL